MTTRLTFQIVLRSDYHVSAGQRAGLQVDSALLRDHDGVPLLRGTAVVGLLRDGLEDLLDLLATQQIGERQWREETALQDAFARLFGSAQKKKLWAYSSARPIDNVSKQERLWEANNVTRLRINPRTRRAAPQQLFQEEEGDNGLVFQFTATCHYNTVTTVADAALLVATARMVRHLGSARRRGRGRCLINLVQAENLLDSTENVTTEAALTLFKENWLDTAQLPTMPEATTPEGYGKIAPTNQRKRFRLMAQLVEPVLVAQRLETGNTIETLSMIPGTAVLGALATRAADAMGLREANAPDLFIQLFLRGGIHASGLLLAHTEGQNAFPTIPAPRVWSQCESYPFFRQVEAKHPFYNSLCDEIPQGCECGGKLKGVGGFVTLQANPVSHQPQRREEMHIQMVRATGRVKEGALYEYVTLEAGQWFMGELSCDEAYWQRFKDLIHLETGKPYALRIGKATRRGYGLVHLFIEELSATDPPSWVRIDLAGRLKDRITENHEATLSLLLLTDTIIADTWGRFYRHFNQQWVAEMLHLLPHTIQLNKQSASSRAIDAFHTHRRVPRWRDEALQAGSAVTFTINKAGLDELLQQWQTATVTETESYENALQWRLHTLEAEGIGLRRHEGFGCIAFNHPLLENIPSYKGIDLLPLPKSMGTPSVKQTGTAFKKWAQRLTSSLKDDARWEKLDDFYATLSRLLFLYRHKPIDQLQKWLHDHKVGHSQHLWGNRTFVGRDKPSRIDGDGLQLVQEWVDDLAKQPAHLWPAGLELLASQLLDQAQAREIAKNESDKAMEVAHKGENE